VHDYQLNVDGHDNVSDFQGVVMFRFEVVLAALVSGLLLSELVEGLARLALRMYLPMVQAGPALQAVLAGALFLLVLLLLYCCLYCAHPGLEAVPPLQFLEREFNIFRKKVAARWPEDWQAETTKTTIFTFDRTDRADIAISVSREGEALHCTEVWAEESLEVIFPARLAGSYQFLLTCRERAVRGAPWVRRVLPGPPDPRQVRPVGLRAATAVLPAGGSFAIGLQLRDAFENHIEATEAHCDTLQVIVDSEAFYEIAPTSSLPHYIQVVST
jgi:hypothetical protein